MADGTPRDALAVIELFVGALVVGLGFLLALVGVAAWRRSGVRRMAFTAAAFACVGAGGGAYLVLLVVQGTPSQDAGTALALGVVAGLAAFYFALFGRDR